MLFTHPPYLPCKKNILVSNPPYLSCKENYKSSTTYYSNNHASSTLPSKHDVLSKQFGYRFYLSI
ncbi:hypothetical protein Hanom_Chr11g01044381 [Helianthus anomalus]